MLETILLFVLAAAIAYLMDGWWSLWWRMKPSTLVPFSLSKTLCRFSRKSSSAASQDRFDGLTKMAFQDTRYQEWMEEVVSRGWATRLEMSCFNKKRSEEIDQELKRRGYR